MLRTVEADRSFSACGMSVTLTATNGFTAIAKWWPAKAFELLARARG